MDPTIAQFLTLIFEQQTQREKSLMDQQAQRDASLMGHLEQQLDRQMVMFTTVLQQTRGTTIVGGKPLEIITKELDIEAARIEAARAQKANEFAAWQEAVKQGRVPPVDRGPKRGG